MPLSSARRYERRKDVHVVYPWSWIYCGFLLDSIIYPYVAMLFITESSLPVSSVPRAIYWTSDFPLSQCVKSLSRTWAYWDGKRSRMVWM